MSRNGEARIDVDSDEFKALPPLIQYEIVSELYARSRETSWSRLEDMLRQAPTASDFSVMQIRNTVKRQRLTATFDDVREALNRVDSAGCALRLRVVGCSRIASATDAPPPNGRARGCTS